MRTPVRGKRYLSMIAGSDDRECRQRRKVPVVTVVVIPSGYCLVDRANSA